ncbi:hypothetical protein GMJLKIPL_4771 [Methylobacterium isbiliense]|uniref:Uncharacterized protein n=1 Tax=Methylobacterium isbiliense TaxID=315478 RepID=A0ABQ4SI52_9HYPH|nr:hypothetical protein GMJLKIPL_4771 [Methylobacterium isbiliense]
MIIISRLTVIVASIQAKLPEHSFVRLQQCNDCDFLEINIRLDFFERIRILTTDQKQIPNPIQLVCEYTGYGIDARLAKSDYVFIIHFNLNTLCAHRST